MESTKNKEKLTLEHQIQKLIDEMHTEAFAAKMLYESRPEKEENIMPLTFGEAFGFNKGVQEFADKLQAILINSGPKGVQVSNESKNSLTADDEEELNEKDIFLVFIPLDRIVPQDAFTKHIKEKHPEIKHLQPVYMIQQIADQVEKFAGLIIIEGHGSQNLLVNLQDRGVTVDKVKVIEYADYTVIGKK